MGFSLFHALGGAAKQYSKTTAKVRDQQMDLFNRQMERTMESYDKAIAERKTKATELRSLGKQLQDMGLNSDQALVVLDNGVDAAKDTVKRLQIAQGYATSKGDTFTASDYVTLANPEVTGMSLDEGIKNIMGIASTAPATEARPEESQYRSVRGLQAGSISSMEKQYGRSMDEIRNIAYGNLEYGATPAGQVSSKLYELEGLEMRGKVADVTTKEAGAQVATETVADQIKQSRLKTKILEADSEYAKQNAENKAKIIEQQVSEGQWNEDTREIKFAQMTEKHNRDMAAMEQTYKGNQLTNAINAVKLQWQGDILNAEFKYKMAQAAAEGKSANLKSADARGIYNSQFENYIKTGALGDFEMVDGIPRLVALDGAAKAEQQQKIDAWHDQMFSSMVKEFGMDSTALAIYGANSKKEVITLDVKVDEAASAEVVDALRNNTALIFDKNGERLGVAKDENGNVVFVPYIEMAALSK